MPLAALVLAAGTSTRYRASGGRRASKLVEDFAGEPMVRHPVRAALSSGCAPVVVVTGHARDEVEAALEGFAVRFVHNAAFATGLAASLRAGLAMVADSTAAVVLLGDMPLVGAGEIGALAAALAADPLAVAAVPVSEGERGNPVVLGRVLFEAAGRLTGDEGARRLLRDPALRVLEVVLEGRAVRLDVDEAGSPPGC